jgi:small subunit ribosomal protein S16
MRMGKAKQPTYRVVVADGRSPRDGRFLEILGTYAPRLEPSGVEIDADKAVAWLHKGARPTETAHKLLTVTGIWERYETERGKPAKPPRTGPPKKRQSKKVAPEAPAPEAPAAADEPAPEPGAETAEGADDAEGKDSDA